MKRTSLIPVSLDFCCWRKNAIACDVCVAASAQCVERDVEAKSENIIHHLRRNSGWLSWLSANGERSPSTARRPA
jgi:hypothetical protein